MFQAAQDCHAQLVGVVLVQMNLLDSILDAGNITATAAAETKMRLNASYPGFRILLRTKSLGRRRRLRRNLYFKILMKMFLLGIF